LENKQAKLTGLEINYNKPEVMLTGTYEGKAPT
jgi:hypothetical protein